MNEDFNNQQNPAKVPNIVVTTFEQLYISRPSLISMIERKLIEVPHPDVTLADNISKNLKRKVLEENLKINLEKRPTIMQLKHRNIYKDIEDVDYSLIGKLGNLKLNMRKDELEKEINKPK